MWGYGVFRIPNKPTYYGQFANDKKHGYGIYEWDDGKKFAGWWNNGK